MFGSNPRKALALAMVAASAAACETGTEPDEGPQFDADAALADHQAVEAILQSQAMASFRALGAGVTFQGVAPEAAFALKVGEGLVTPTTPTQARAFTRHILSEAGKVGPGPFSNPIISVFRRGKTFAYDPGLGRYVWDEDRAGAPETGVRFILYRPGGDGKPDPAAEIGHVDLIDEGDDSAEEIALRLEVVEGETTILQYRTTLDVMESGGRITVSGFLQGEQDRLTFDIQVTGSEGQEQNTVDITFGMGIVTREFYIDGSVHGVKSDSGEGGDIDLTVEHGDDSFQVDVTGTATSIDGTFHLNQVLFAVVAGDPAAPTFTGASGGPLTLVEMLVLGQILDSTEDVFDFFEDLLDPIDELVILALIL